MAMAEETTEDGEEPAEEQSPDAVAMDHAEAVERARAGAERIREMMNG